MHQMTGIWGSILIAASAVGCKGKTEDKAPPTAATAAIVANTAPAAPTPTPPPAATASTVAQPTGADALVAPVDFGAPGPVVIEPAIALKRGEGGDHAKPFGWAKDSSELGACREADGTGALECTFLKPGSKPELVTDFSADSGIDEQKTKAIKDRIAAKGYSIPGTTWPYASDLTLTWKGACDQDKSTCVFRAGAVVKGEEADFPFYAESKDVLGVHAEAYALSPDSKWLGVIAHSAGGSGSNKFELRILSVTAFAAQIYNDAGFAHHKKGEFERSALLFHKAATADPTHKLAAYNYACALGRLKHPGTEAALKAASAVGGDKVKPRAAKDSDFASVNAEDWFIALTK